MPPIREPGYVSLTLCFSPKSEPHNSSVSLDWGAGATEGKKKKRDDHASATRVEEEAVAMVQGVTRVQAVHRGVAARRKVYCHIMCHAHHTTYATSSECRTRPMPHPSYITTSHGTHPSCDSISPGEQPVPLCPVLSYCEEPRKT